MLTLPELKEALPRNLQTAASQSLVDKLNTLAGDPEAAEVMREKTIGYAHVLKEGRFKVEEYINAVAYVSWKVMGFTNQESWKRVFPQRYQALVARGADEKTISAYVAGYNRGKLVNLIYEQTLVPTWVMNQDIHQRAVNHLAHLMVNANSEKVQSDSAAALLQHLKKPDSLKAEISIGVEDHSGMSELRDMLTGMVEKQQSLIAQGVQTKAIAHQSLGSKDIIDITPVRSEDDGTENSV